MENDLNPAIIRDAVALFTVLFFAPFLYQIKILQDNSRRIAFRSARQIGKTTVIAIKALHHALNKPDGLVLCIAPSLRQSSLIFYMIRRGCRHPLISHLVVRETADEIEFSNGARIICLPGSNPKTITGNSPTLLIIDEAAELKEETFTEVLPSLRFTKGDLIFISTPHGKTGRFYEAFNSDAFSKHHVKAIECTINTQEELDEERKLMTEMEYERMIMGEFVEAMDAWFPRSLVLGCVAEVETHEAPRSHTEYHLGVDIARYGLDETVYTIIAHNSEGENSVVNIRHTSKLPLTDVTGRIQFLHGIFNFVGIYVDESGLGGGVVDSLQQKGVPITDLNNESGGVQFTLQNKEYMYKNLKLLMEQGKIKFPKHDKLIQQLSDLQYEFTESGHVKLKHPDGGHDDFPDSLALACAGLGQIQYKPYVAK